MFSHLPCYSDMWLKWYLSDRIYIVIYAGYTSLKVLIICSVPQGSVLGPLLFLYFIQQTFLMWLPDTKLDFIHSVDQYTAAALMHAFITGRLDYCNCLLAGDPRVVTDVYQNVQNAAARLLTGHGRRQHGL